MQKKNIIYALTVLFIILVFFVFRELPIKVETVPATVSLPRITWINSKPDTERFAQTQVHIRNDTGVTLVCPEKKLVFPTEDILCMKPPRYSPSYRNPCWYPDESDKLSCLPYFLQIGMSKCATTDLFTRLILHPDIIPISGANGKNKSITWWNLRLTGSTWQPPYSGGKRENFKQYSEYFSNAAKVIETNKDQTGYHGKITGEGSPTYLWMLYLWNRIPQNTYLTKPKVLVPHLIRHVLPKTKFIVTLRDPIERMYSSYHFFNKDKKYDKFAFHETMQFAIEKFMECKAMKGDRQCVLDPDLRATISRKVRLLNSMYYLYIKEWLDVFPRQQFIFIKMEEYVTNKEEVLNRIFKFLGLSTLSPTEMKKYGLLFTTIKNKTKGGKQYEPMLNATREMLYSLYDPYTKMLPQLLNDPSFTWSKVSYEEYVQRMLRKKVAS
ncbi:carbohydrate sulfotransferase 15-like [Mytilus californianus]|uniref:carbohydrate sulfotransferase 15-like n=1 Tax=Mytilus californianus TaxID=6549 RepID=UPI0022481364|nr:carbohydrate sulfotransferase 15-like [Mytilus californianus]